MSQELTSTEIAAFRRDGIVVTSSGLSDQLLDGVLADLEALPPKLLDEYRAGRIQDAWKHCSRVRAAAVESSILSKLEQLYGATPRPFQTLNFPKGTEQRPHSDSIHFNSQPFGMMCGVWLALEDIGPNQGPLIYYPGSQELPEFNFEDIGLPPSYEHYTGYEDHVEALVQRHGFQPSYGLLERGQIIIWAANVLHGGSSQIDKTLTRKSQVTHYYFAGCRYWRPGLSKRQRAFFEPGWIPCQNSKGRNLLRYAALRAKNAIVNW